ncbi:hypothetical protein Ndes2526B_g03439 [Nannochloris sp. 'desiccata']|nr:hypothetical protein KSW81_006362 [Chlorella desiccata (nom. nud.)]
MATTIRALRIPLGVFSRAYATVDTASSSLPQEISLSSTAICIWGSNTGVGKTLFSAGLADACRRQQQSLLYLKPVQTGFPEDSDAKYVAAVLGTSWKNSNSNKIQYTHGPHAAHLLENRPPLNASKPLAQHVSSEYLIKTLFAWRDPVSPHIAVEIEGRPVSDTAIVSSVAEHLNAFQRNVAIVETAGGVGSPGPSGSLQSDILRPLRLPAVLVGDGKLGGISATLTAFESLRIRGYDVPVIVLMDPEGKNWKAIQRHVGGKDGSRNSTIVLPFGACKEIQPGSPGTELLFDKDGKINTYIVEENLQRWLEENKDQFDHLLAAAHEQHHRRLDNLRHAAEQAKEVFWWPFTQHGNLKNVNVVDARAGEHYAVYNAQNDKKDKSRAAEKLLFEYDGCASWWTQGMSQEALPAMARAIGYSTARYGHIIFPQTVHAPALEIAQRAVDLVGRGWAKRAFFTDNGSTAVEVALKMAFRKYAVDHDMIFSEAFLKENKKLNNGNCGGGAQPNFAVLGLQEAYHGDTLGAMDAVAPSVFNGPLQTPWFKGRGLFLDPPTVGLRKGVWEVAVPACISGVGGSNGIESFKSLEDVFSIQERKSSELSKLYRSHIEQYIDKYEATGSTAGEDISIAACIIEPVLQGAGGMRLIDPEFQRAMAAACKTRNIPLILDEVFTGFWRLGESSAAAMLGVLPDIACYAKLLTGGVVPMSLTLASNAVFQAFQGDSKAYALLHGHSYTAHPLGCAAAVQALDTFTNPELNPNLCTPEVPDRCLCSTSTTNDSKATAVSPFSFSFSSFSSSSSFPSSCSVPCGKLRPLWDPARLIALSHHPKVDRLISLGTVVALELKISTDAGGYASNAAAGVVTALRTRGVFARPLGNVVYIMVTPMTKAEKCEELLGALEASLNDEES